jgi:hypothetical protein
MDKVFSIFVEKKVDGKMIEMYDYDGDDDKKSKLERNVVNSNINHYDYILRIFQLTMMLVSFMVVFILIDDEELIILETKIEHNIRVIGSTSNSKSIVNIMKFQFCTVLNNSTFSVPFVNENYSDLIDSEALSIYQSLKKLNIDLDSESLRRYSCYSSATSENVTFKGELNEISPKHFYPFLSYSSDSEDVANLREKLTFNPICSLRKRYKIVYFFMVENFGLPEIKNLHKILNHNDCFFYFHVEKKEVW